MDTGVAPLVVHPEQGVQPSCCVVLLHGYGQPAKDLLPVARAWARAVPGLRVVLPTAKLDIREYRTRRWYRISDKAWDNPEGWENASQETALAGVLSVVRSEQRRVPPGRVLLAGFSQGGQVAISAALRAAARGSPTLAGVIALAPACLIKREVPAQVRAPFPVLVTWGGRNEWDHNSAVDACTTLRRAGVPVFPSCVPGLAGHKVSAKMEAVSAQWLAALFSGFELHRLPPDIPASDLGPEPAAPREGDGVFFPVTAYPVSAGRRGAKWKWLETAAIERGDDPPERAPRAKRRRPVAPRRYAPYPSPGGR